EQFLSARTIVRHLPTHIGGDNGIRGTGRNRLQKVPRLPDFFIQAGVFNRKGRLGRKERQQFLILRCERRGGAVIIQQNDAHQPVAVEEGFGHDGRGPQGGEKE